MLYGKLFRVVVCHEPCGCVSVCPLRAQTYVGRKRAAVDRICVGVPPGEVRTDPQRHTATHCQYPHLITYGVVIIIEKTNIDGNHDQIFLESTYSVLLFNKKNMVHALFILALNHFSASCRMLMHFKLSHQSHYQQQQE